MSKAAQSRVPGEHGAVPDEGDREEQPAAAPQAESDAGGVEVLAAHDLRVAFSGSGLRVGAEPFALVAALAGPRFQRAADLGCGSGIIPLLLARAGICNEIWGIEIDEEDCGLARRNVRENGLAGRIVIRRGHVRSAVRALARGTFDLITCKPPWFTEPRQGNSAERATHAVHGGLPDFLHAAAHLAKRGGTLALILHAAAWPRIPALLTPFRFGPERLIPVQPSTGKPAVCVIVLAKARSTPQPAIMPPLILDNLSVPSTG